jgi:hypothetical protein
MCAPAMIAALPRRDRSDAAGQPGHVEDAVARRCPDRTLRVAAAYNADVRGGDRGEVRVMKFTDGSKVLRLWLVVSALVASSVVATQRDVSADSIDDAVKQLVDLDKVGDDAKCAAKAQEMKGSNDPRVVAAFLDLEKSAGDATACAAIKLLASRKDAKSLEWMKSKLGDKELPKEKGGRPEVFKCILESLAVYRDASALKPLEDVVKTYLTTDADYASRAIRAYGSVPQKSVVDQLIDWLGQLEQSHGGKSSGGSGGHTKFTPEVQRARDTSRDVLLKTLIAVTDKDVGDYADWKKWWPEHSKGFEFPKADAMDRQIDVTTLSQWTDTRYGYTVKRPDGKGWTFKPEDAHFRIQLLKVEDGGAWPAFVGWGIYSLAGSNIKDVKDYTDWWVKQQFPEHEIERYAADGEPTVEQKKFAGRDWTVITAKGIGKEALASWGAMEHRVYFTKTDVRFIYAWAVVKTTTSPDDKQKTWDSVEGVGFSAK